MVLKACRYFGHTRDYWWGNLTWSLYFDLEWELAERPPADQLLAFYFEAQKWWSRPQRTAFAGESSGDDDNDSDVWESPLPDRTD